MKEWKALNMVKEVKQVPWDIAESSQAQETWMIPWTNTSVLYMSSLYAFKWDTSAMSRLWILEMGFGLLNIDKGVNKVLQT